MKHNWLQKQRQKTLSYGQMATLTLFLLCLVYAKTQAQDVMMQGWYWDYPKTAGGFKWTDTLRSKAPELGRAGINYLWIPPHVRASFGNNSNGYDPQDYYDLGEFGRGPTGLGTRAEFNAMIQALQQNNISSVGDMIYNHRDGGRPENNPALKTYMEGFNNAANNPFPTDRYHLILPIGGTTGNGAGTYFITFASRTGNAKFVNAQIKLYAATNRRNTFSGNTLNIPNEHGGLDCSEPTFTGALVTDVFFNLATCGTEIRFNISANDFNATGDTLFLYLRNPNNNFTDHWVKKLWRVNDSGTPANADIRSQVAYQTFTNFSQMPSRRGAMRWHNFKPNGKPTNLGGDWDSHLFFYDYDQSTINDNLVTVPITNHLNQTINVNPGKNTQDTLFEWTRWSLQATGIRGLRVDAIKHFDPQFMSGLLNFLNQNNINPGMVVGEWLDTNFGNLSGWINQVKAGMTPAALAAIKPKVFDFSLRENLRQACDDGGFNVRNVFGGTLGSSGNNGILPENVVSFTNNHDFREGAGFNSVIRNNSRAILAYAYIFTNARAGTPLIFYPDYYGYPPPAAAPSTLWSYHPTNLSPMRTRIDQLIQLYHQYTWQSSWVDYLNANTGGSFVNYVEGSANRALIYQLQGNVANKRVLVAINFSGSRLRADVELRGGMVNGQRMIDVLGVSNTQTLTLENKNILSQNRDRMVYIDIPANSYAVWVEGDNVMSPSALVATATSTTAIRLNWVDNAGNETGYRVERSPNGTANWTEIANNLPAGTNTFTDTGLTGNTTHFYRVRAFLTSPSLLSNYTNIAQATTINIPAPTALTAVASSTNQGVINVSWTDNATNETSFVLERSTTGTGNWQNINIAANVTTYSDGGLSEGTYFYRIRARLSNVAQGIDAFSAYSNTANATITPPTALENIALNKQISLFPNPTKDWVNISFDVNLAKQNAKNIIQLFDAQGNDVSTKINTIKTNTQSQQITYSLEVNNLPKGTYLVWIETNKGKGIKKFVIE